jgi:hypothetical protein
VVVEEAAEVLESDLLAALSPGLQHLVLIGDHKQLRPNVDTYRLKKHFHFDISMMERLIGNQFQFQTLCLQNRMRPEFSNLLRGIYPDLQDNLDKVSKHEPAEGLLKSMVFWNHDKPEAVGRSKSNVEECRRAVLLAEYLMITGIKSEQITILAAYQGQVSEIRNLITQRKISKVQVSTIDRYQGDENDFVIISLVRSNPQGDLGFMAEESRRCVAQSRARCGMFLIGNATTLTSKTSSTWISMLNTMRDGNWMSYFLPVQCVKHKSASVAEIADANSLEELVGKSGKLCKLTCGHPFSCDIHQCPKPCFPSHDHEFCKAKVSFIHEACGHEGTKQCHTNAKHVQCTHMALLKFINCEHEIVVKCAEKQAYDQGHRVKECEAVIDAKAACGHTVTKLCHADLSKVVCEKMVNYTGACGHNMTRKCYESIRQIRCQFTPCKRLRKCGHSCINKCGEDCESGPCNSIVYYTGACGHPLDRTCNKPESQIKCEFRPCARERSCGHPCVNTCGEQCDAGDCADCKSAHKKRIEENRQKAKDRVKELKEQIKKKSVSVLSRRKLDEGPEYMSVCDRVTKYVLPMHNWYPNVTKVEKVQNLKLEIEYEKYKSIAFGEHEDLKFHGTDDVGVNGIVKNGFRLGKPGMYGAGVYFATDSSKSSQQIYTKGSNKLLLCQVFLGKAKTVISADKSLTKERLKSEGCDSVFAPRGTKGSGGVLNDEFVVFDTRQAFVKYVIHYENASASHPSFKSLACPDQAFRTVTMMPGRVVNVNDPLENSYRFAEGHFLRMMLKYRAGQISQIRAITVVVNPALAAKFEEKRKSFTRKGKGKLV